MCVCVGGAYLEHVKVSEHTLLETRVQKLIVEGHHFINGLRLPHASVCAHRDKHRKEPCVTHHTRLYHPYSLLTPPHSCPSDGAFIHCTSGVPFATCPRTDATGARAPLRSYNAECSSGNEPCVAAAHKWAPGTCADCTPTNTRREKEEVR